MALSITVAFRYHGPDTEPESERDRSALDLLEEFLGHPHEPGEWDEDSQTYYYTWDRITSESLFRAVVAQCEEVWIHRTGDDGDEPDDAEIQALAAAKTVIGEFVRGR